MQPETPTHAELSELFIYPVKSLRGFAVDHWPVDRRGLRYDRRWMVVDARGHFLSQRQVPEMTLIRTSIEQDLLILTDADGETLRIPLEPPAGSTVEVTVWRDRVSACTVGEPANTWLGRRLKRDCALVYLPEESHRAVDRDYGGVGDEVGFADGFPFLLVSEASLHALNGLMDLPVAMERFRPNLVVKGCSAYAEDTWRNVHIGDISLRLPKPCSRCTIPSIDPDTARRDREPLETLNRTRRWNNKLYFGQNAVHDNTGILAKGDAVSILFAGPAQPPL